MTTRTATKTEIRNHYKDDGHTVRISRDGHVTFKRDGEGEWLEGRYVEEYKMTEEYGVVLV